MADERRPMSTAALAGREEQPKAPDPEQPDNALSTGETTPDIKIGTPPRAEPTGNAEQSRTPLLATREAEDFQSRWDESQRSFVDEPRTSVQQADQLVAELMQLLASGFATERQNLESQWDRGEEVSTEDLRMALQRYRSFFQRLLAV